MFTTRQLVTVWMGVIFLSIIFGLLIRFLPIPTRSASGPTIVGAQVLPKGMKTSLLVPASIVEPATVDLPNGQKFVSIISANDSGKLGHNYLNVYITVDRPVGEEPRRLTFYQPGYSPKSWNAMLYIQEH